MHHEKAETFRPAIRRGRKWTKPQLRSFKLSAEELDQIRSAADPKEAFKNAYLARKNSGS